MRSDEWMLRSIRAMSLATSLDRHAEAVLRGRYAEGLHPTLAAAAQEFRWLSEKLRELAGPMPASTHVPQKLRKND